MHEDQEERNKENHEKDRVAGNVILLDGRGEFPKVVRISTPRGMVDYRLVRTNAGKFLLCK